MPHSCPFLPEPRPGLDWRSLHAYREKDRGEAFYFACLEYGHALWERGLPARALLCADRAFGADIRGHEALVKAWPLPYAATAWMLRHSPEGVFIGNPRVHFQHYADRMSGPRSDQRRWRAWACWAITRRLLPSLEADPRHLVREPSEDEIFEKLLAHGIPEEASLWTSVLDACANGRFQGE